MRRTARAIALTTLGLAALTACSSATTQIESSRAELYDSLGALIGDTSDLVHVSVRSTHVTDELDDVIPHTIAQAEVIQSFVPDGLGSTLTTGSPSTPLAPGASIQVVQMGGDDTISLGEPMLEADHSYLLFLTPTLLQGAYADAYYVVGVSAGIYAMPSVAEFRSVGTPLVATHEGPLQGDSIPIEIQVEDLQ